MLFLFLSVASFAASLCAMLGNSWKTVSVNGGSFPEWPQMTTTCLDRYVFYQGNALWVTMAFGSCAR